MMALSFPSVSCPVFGTVFLQAIWNFVQSAVKARNLGVSRPHSPSWSLICNLSKVLLILVQQQQKTLLFCIFTTTAEIGPDFLSVEPILPEQEPQTALPALGSMAWSPFSTMLSKPSLHKWTEIMPLVIICTPVSKCVVYEACHHVVYEALLEWHPHPLHPGLLNGLAFLWVHMLCSSTHSALHPALPLCQVQSMLRVQQQMWQVLALTQITFWALS